MQFYIHCNFYCQEYKFTYLPILSQHHIQPIATACNKDYKLRDHQQLTFEIFSRTFMLIYPPSPSFLLP